MRYKQFLELKICFLFLVIFSACAPLQKQTSETEEQKPDLTTNLGKVSASFEETPPLPPKGYFLKQLAKDLYFFSTGKDNTLFAITSEGTLLVDPLKGSGTLLQKAMIEAKAPPVKMMIYSHGDLRRIGSAYLFSDNVRVVTHRETAEFIRSFGESNIPKPSISFGKSYSLKLGGLRVELKYPMREGGQGKIIVYFPDQKVLMYTDVATPKTAPPTTLKVSNIFKRAKGLKEVLNYNFESYISGNYYRPGSKAEAKEILNYFYSTKSANKKALLFNSSKEKAGNRSIAENCLRILEPRWSGRLKGFKTSAKAHCEIWTEFHSRKTSSPVKLNIETKN